MNISIKPTHAIVTVGNTDGSVDVNRVPLADVSSALDNTNRTAEEHRGFALFLADAGAVGNFWEVVDVTGDVVASVVLV